MLLVFRFFGGGQYLIRGAILLLCSLCIPALPARGQLDIASEEIDGLVLDRTLTRAGRDFFRQYVSRLGVEDGVPGFNLVVREKVSAQWGSLLTVEANDQVIFREALRPRTEGHGEEAERAATATVEFLLRSAEGPLQQEELSPDGL